MLAFINWKILSACFELGSVVKIVVQGRVICQRTLPPITQRLYLYGRCRLIRKPEKQMQIQGIDYSSCKTWRRHFKIKHLMQNTCESVSNHLFETIPGTSVWEKKHQSLHCTENLFYFSRSAIGNTYKFGTHQVPKGGCTGSSPNFQVKYFSF